jgi:hypothetical protein
MSHANGVAKKANDDAVEKSAIAEIITLPAAEKAAMRKAWAVHDEHESRVRKDVIDKISADTRQKS